MSPLSVRRWAWSISLSARATTGSRRTGVEVHATRACRDRMAHACSCSVASWWSLAPSGRHRRAAWLTFLGRAAASREPASTAVLAWVSCRCPSGSGRRSDSWGRAVMASARAIIVRAGDNGRSQLEPERTRRTGSRPVCTRWERGITRRSSPGPGAAFVGAPGAVLDGQHATSTRSTGTPTG